MAALPAVAALLLAAELACESERVVHVGCASSLLRLVHGSRHVVPARGDAAKTAAPWRDGVQEHDVNGAHRHGCGLPAAAAGPPPTSRSASQQLMRPRQPRSQPGQRRGAVKTQQHRPAPASQPARPRGTTHNTALLRRKMCLVGRRCRRRTTAAAAANCRRGPRPALRPAVAGRRPKHTKKED